MGCFQCRSEGRWIHGTGWRCPTDTSNWSLSEASYFMPGNYHKKEEDEITVSHCVHLTTECIWRQWYSSLLIDELVTPSKLSIRVKQGRAMQSIKSAIGREYLSLCPYDSLLMMSLGSSPGPLCWQDVDVIWVSPDCHRPMETRMQGTEVQHLSCILYRYI